MSEPSTAAASDRAADDSASTGASRSRGSTGGTLDAVTVTSRPTVASTVATVAAAVAALVALGVAAPTTLALGSAGVAFVTTGLWVGWRWRRLAGVAVALVGVPLVLAAIARSWSGVASATVFATVAPALLGALVVAVALGPGLAGRRRTFLKAGTGLVYVAVLVAGVTQAASFGALALATVATVASYDAGETAVTLGEQLGREPRTWPNEAVHLGATALVGAVAVGASRVLRGLDTPGLPLGQFAVLLVAVVGLLVALHE